MNINVPCSSHVPALRHLWKEAFGDTDEFLDIFFQTAFHPSRCRCILDGEQVVAALYWFGCEYEGNPIAYIYAVATAKSHRGQGLCYKLLADTHQQLSIQGYAGALLVPGSKELFDMYQKMGYKTVAFNRQFECSIDRHQPPERIVLYPIDGSEYTKLRKHLLPKGSVLQENENLTFLQTQVRFYMGFGFLLAAYNTNDTLYGIELLGDISAASAITYSLGFSHGVFRTPGNSRPFAMYHSLNPAAPFPPTYFGFAFD